MLGTGALRPKFGELILLKAIVTITGAQPLLLLLLPNVSSSCSSST